MILISLRAIPFPALPRYRRAPGHRGSPLYGTARPHGTLRAGVGGGAVNTFVYGPDLNNVEAELRALQQAAAEKNCPANIAKAPGKPEPGMGPIH